VVGHLVLDAEVELALAAHSEDGLNGEHHLVAALVRPRTPRS
jgi:hypothetical protein